MDLETLSLTSVSSIIGATLVFVEVLKRVFGNVPIFKKIPVWIYAVITAIILTFVANKLGYLPGDVKALLWQAAVNAMASSGFYTWLRNKEGPETASTLPTSDSATTKIIIFGLLSLILTGCASDKVILREAMYSGTQTMRSQYLDWAKDLTINPDTGKNNCEAITPLTPTQYQQILNTNAEFEALVKEDRNND